DLLIAWCDEDADIRYELMSTVVTFSRGSGQGVRTWTPLATKMIERAPQPTKILATFIERFSPRMWEGSRAAHVESYAALLDNLGNNLDAAIHTLATTNRAELKVEIDQWRAQELAYSRVRDESFE